MALGFLGREALGSLPSVEGRLISLQIAIKKLPREAVDPLCLEPFTARLVCPRQPELQTARGRGVEVG